MKKCILKTLFNRAYIACSTDYHLKKELDHLRYVFQKHKPQSWGHVPLFENLVGSSTPPASPYPSQQKEGCTLW